MPPKPDPGDQLAASRRIISACLALCLLIAVVPAAATATDTTQQSSDDCEIQLDPPADAEYDVHVVGYTASSNIYHVTVTDTSEGGVCPGEDLQHMWKILLYVAADAQ